ncbi:MAG: hypothetical protein MUF80_02190 [Burkholderiales bacterium]|nr:hypothetical protein [Burkholderiales bacterium]
MAPGTGCGCAEGRSTPVWLLEVSRTESPHRPNRSARFLTHYDCQERASAETQSVFYDASGEVVGKVTEDPRNTRLTYVVPGLLSESTLNFACKPMPPAAKKKS